MVDKFTERNMLQRLQLVDQPDFQLGGVSLQSRSVVVRGLGTAARPVVPGAANNQNNSLGMGVR